MYPVREKSRFDATKPGNVFSAQNGLPACASRPGGWCVVRGPPKKVRIPSVLEVIWRVDLRAPICRARFGRFWGHIGAQSLQVQFWGSFLQLRTSRVNLATMPQNQAPQDISGRKSTRKMTSRTEGVRIWGPRAMHRSPAKSPWGMRGASARNIIMWGA